MEVVGFFHQSEKIWINNRLDANDIVGISGKGEEK